MAARRRTWTPEVVRQRLRVGMLAKSLQDHVLGNRKMKSTQVRAAIFLIERIVPRAEAAKSLNISGSLTLEQLIRQAAGVLEKPESEPAALN